MKAKKKNADFYFSFFGIDLFAQGRIFVIQIDCLFT